MARGAKIISDALRLYAVVDVAAARDHVPNEPSLTFVQFRDLAAAVVPSAYTRTTLGEGELKDYIGVVDELATHGPVLPAPPGAVFRDADVLQRWLELHYAKLLEALGEVERRPGTTAPYDFVQMDLGD